MWDFHARVDYVFSSVQKMIPVSMQWVMKAFFFFDLLSCIELKQFAVKRSTGGMTENNRTKKEKTSDF